MKKILFALIALFCLTGCTSEQIYIPEDFDVVNKEAAFIFPYTNKGGYGIIDVSDGNCILAGCGSSEEFPVLYETLRKREIEEISAIILQTDTPGCNGALGKILSNFKVKRVYVCEYIKDRDKYRELCRNNSDGECSFYIAAEGTRIHDEDGLVIDVVSSALCDGVGTLSLYAIFGDKAFFFDGATDSKTAEDIIATVGDRIASSVYVVTEPDVWTSSHKELLQRTRADFVTVNGECEPEVATALIRDAKEVGAELKRNDANGNITFVTDGKGIKCYTER